MTEGQPRVAEHCRAVCHGAPLDQIGQAAASGTFAIVHNAEPTWTVVNVIHCPLTARLAWSTP